MAIVYDAPVTPDDLTAFVREFPTPAEFALSAGFPVRTENDNTIDFGAEVVRRNRTARFRSYDGRIHVSERDAGEGRRVKLPPLSSSLTRGEYERLQVEFARTGGTNTSALVNAIYNDAEQLIREIRARMELAWGDVLTDGVLSINENGFQGESDYGVPANHKVTAATAWTDVAAPALTNLITWHDTYVATKGAPAGAMRTSNRVLRLLTRNTEIINAVHGSAAGRTMVTVDDLNSLLVSLGLPPLVPTYDTQVVGAEDDVVRVMPEDRLLFTPASLADLGYTCFGVSATALELVNAQQSDMSFADAPGVVGVVDKSGPPYREQTLVDAVGMPILTDARALFIATVL